MKKDLKLQPAADVSEFFKDPRVIFFINEVPGGWFDIHHRGFENGLTPALSFFNPTMELRDLLVYFVKQENLTALGDLWDEYGLEAASTYYPGSSRMVH